MFIEKNINWMGHCKASLTALFTGLMVALISALTDFDLFEEMVRILESFETYEIDELFILLLLLPLGLLFDLVDNVRQKQCLLEVRDQRLRVLKATMTSVLHIVNNFLNSLQLFRMDADENQVLSPQSLVLLDDAIDKTSRKLKTLADLNDTPEIEVFPGIVEIDYEGKGGTMARKKQNLMVLG